MCSACLNRMPCNYGHCGHCGVEPCFVGPCYVAYFIQYSYINQQYTPHLLTPGQQFTLTFTISISRSLIISIK